ncbi:MAG: inositol monophosphatase family protein [Pirellulaceae bacterium]
MREFLSVCEQAARAGGAVLLDWQHRFTPREKGLRDLVTEADVASQKAIRDILLGRFPDHDFLGEEDASFPEATKTSGNSEYRWIVDPLDGTANYVHHMPAFAVTIALQKAGETILGIVFDPIANEFFHAVKGEGAFLAGKRIESSGCTSAEQAMVAVSFAPNVPRGSVEIGRFVEALHSCQSVRRLGSAALNLAYLAAGRLDAYWATSVKIWDVAAGLLMVEEAGGTVSHISGGQLDLNNPDFLASASQPLQMEMLRIISRAC